MSFDWKQLVGSVAPALGAALGGPFGGMAGKFLADKLGVDEADLPDTIANANPETMLKIKNLDNEFKVKMRELDISEEDLHHKDRSSARSMMEKTSMIPQAIISAIFIIGFVVALYLVLSGKAGLDDGMKDTAIFLSGILSAGVTQIMNFWFGSSSGSKEKTNLMRTET